MYMPLHPLRGFNSQTLSPGANAPGFMLQPASQAKTFFQSPATPKSRGLLLRITTGLILLPYARTELYLSV